VFETLLRVVDRDEVQSGLIGLCGVHVRRIKQMCVIRRFQRSGRAFGIAFVAFFDVLQKHIIVGGLAGFFQFLETAVGADFGGRGHKEFHIGFRANDRANVAAVQNGTFRFSAVFKKRIRDEQKKLRDAAKPKNPAVEKIKSFLFSKQTAR